MTGWRDADPVMSVKTSHGAMTMNQKLARMETFFFSHRLGVLAAMAGLTLVMAILASQLHVVAGFEKQLPTKHPFIQTFDAYRDQLFGANRLTIVVHARQGDVWTRPVLTRVLDVTNAVSALPGVDRSQVKSVWTPNVFFTEITEEGFKAEPLAGGDVVPSKLTDAVIATIRGRVVAGGHMGTLVSRDSSGAMVMAELMDRDPGTGAPLDYIALNRQLEHDLRQAFEDSEVEIQIIGFAKQIGDIAALGGDVMTFFAIAFLMTAVAVYWYCHSVRLTLLPLLCSLVSLIWQFGTLRLLGYGLDPLAVLVPFLVFAIGVSHGVQQINFMLREIAHGKSTFVAARNSFSSLLVPGSLALVTAFVSFITLTLIPIPMIQELAVTASIGVFFKIATNLVMLPVVASFFHFTGEFAREALLKRERRSEWLRAIARIAKPRNALVVAAVGGVVFAVAVWQGQGRHVGSLEPGAPELRADSRFNQDAASIVSRFDVGLDWLTVVFEVDERKGLPACARADVMLFIDSFAWSLSATPGVLSSDSMAQQMKLYNAGMNEGHPGMTTITRDPMGLGSEVAGANDRLHGLASADCTVQGVNLYLADHKATTIKTVIAAVRAFERDNRLDGVRLRLASGNVGVQAATNEVLENSELSMMLYVYAAIILLVYAAYRDVRAVLACCLPLAVGTAIGDWFMKSLDIGLTVATLPVMVLAVGVGVDYAFYIYNRLQLHLRNGVGVTKALEQSLMETGLATIFTALTLSIGVATWAFSDLKFQADMGKLLAFMFMVNMVTAITLLPAFAAVLERWFPRRGAVAATGFAHH